MAAWDRQETETGPAYVAFCAYRDLGPSRSVDKAYSKATGTQLGGKRAANRWWEWAAEHEWKRRAEAYDGHLELKARAAKEDEHLKDLAEFRDRQKRLARANIEAAINLLSKASARLKDLKPEEIPTVALPAFFRAAASVAESGTNSEAQALAVEELLKAMDGSSNHGESGS